MQKSLLTVNTGSSSIKISLFKIQQNGIKRFLDVDLKGIASKQVAKLEIVSGTDKHQEDISSDITISQGIQKAIDLIASKHPNILDSLMVIGHRFVHGGKKYCASILLNQEVIENLKSLSDLAPLHNDACLEGIQGCRDYFGESFPQVAVFDTAFHSDMPEVASHYAIPKELAEAYQIKRYGFHGISHQYLWESFLKEFPATHQQAKVITLHLGSGCSMAAIKGGKSLDTTMGFTPAEGLMMATRAGDVDAAILEYLDRFAHKKPQEVMGILNHQSGLLGISQKSLKMQELVEDYNKDENARLAVDLFCYRIVKYLGAYLAVLQGIDALIFSGGIGENAFIVRKMIIEKMNWYGVEIDSQANEQAVGLSPGNVHEISKKSSKVKVLVIATDENFLIAKESLKLGEIYESHYAL